MSFEKLEIIAKPVEDKDNRWTVGWKASVNGEVYGQWIELANDEPTLRAVLEVIADQAFHCFELLEQKRKLKGEE